MVTLCVTSRGTAKLLFTAAGPFHSRTVMSFLITKCNGKSEKGGSCAGEGSQKRLHGAGERAGGGICKAEERWGGEQSREREQLGRGPEVGSWAGHG